MNDGKPESRRRGRPQLVTDDAILQAAFRAFATHGYDAVSVRTLNRELGGSHSLIRERYGSKAGLWRAAIDHAFGAMAAEMREVVAAAPSASDDPLAALHALIRGFVAFNARHPHMYALMSIEGQQHSERLQYIYDTYAAPAVAPTERLLRRLADDGVIRPISARAFVLLVAHGATAPFALAPFAELLGKGSPTSPKAVAEHAQLMADVIVGGLRVD